MNHQRLFIDGPAGRLQAIYQPAEGKRHDEPAAVLICHPHPLYGGTMRNKVVYWMARAFEEAGHSVLRFNFRGVEQSEGAWDDGVGETEDARAAIHWLEAQNPTAPIWVAGFSFGCYAGLKAASDEACVQRLFAISPAVEHYPFDFLNGDWRPLTVIQGTADEIVPADAVVRWAKSLPQARLITIADAGHFYPRHQKELQQALLPTFQHTG